MKAPCWALVAACILLGGCATRVPEFDLPHEHGRPTVQSITRRIACELQQIVLENDLNQLLINDNDIDVTMQLSLDVTDDGALAPTFTYTNGIFSFGTGVTAERSRDQNFSAELFYSMKALRDAARNDIDQLGKLSFCDLSFQTDLAGTLGLKENFSLATTAEPDLNWKTSGSGGVFGGSVTFTIKQELTPTGPTFTLTHYKTPGSFLTASENHIDKLTFAFVVGKDAKSHPRAAANAKQKGRDFINSIQTNQINTNLGLMRQ